MSKISRAVLADTCLSQWGFFFEKHFSEGLSGGELANEFKRVSDRTAEDVVAEGIHALKERAFVFSLSKEIGKAALDLSQGKPWAFQDPASRAAFIGALRTQVSQRKKKGEGLPQPIPA